MATNRIKIPDYTLCFDSAYETEHAVEEPRRSHVGDRNLWRKFSQDLFHFIMNGNRPISLIRMGTDAAEMNNPLTYGPPHFCKRKMRLAVRQHWLGFMDGAPEARLSDHDGKSRTVCPSPLCAESALIVLR
jgi:hypothetical protein